MPSVASDFNTTVLNKSLSSMVKGIRGHKDKWRAGRTSTSVIC